MADKKQPAQSTTKESSAAAGKKQAPESKTPASIKEAKKSPAAKKATADAETPPGKKQVTETATPTGQKAAQTETVTPTGKKEAQDSKSPTPSDKKEDPADATDDRESGTKSTTYAADSEPSGEGSTAPLSESGTEAPGIGDSQYTTTSIVTTTGTEKSVKKRRGMSKIEAANVYVYGHVEEPWQRRDIKPSSDSDVTVRANRAQTMRQSCIMRRTKAMEREQLLRKKELESQLSEDEEDQPDPIVARKVPQHVYDQPKVPIKDTRSSKFRYLYNRKPAGVKVYFKPANADPKKKPPFVVIGHT